MANCTACGAHLQRPHVAELHDQPALHQSVAPSSCTVSMPLLPSHSQASHSVCWGVLCQRVLIQHLQPGCVCFSAAQTMPAGVLPDGRKAEAPTAAPECMQQHHGLDVQHCCPHAGYDRNTGQPLLRSGFCLISMWPALHGRCCAAGGPDDSMTSPGLAVASTSRVEASQAAHLALSLRWLLCNSSYCSTGHMEGTCHAASRPDVHTSS